MEEGGEEEQTLLASVAPMIIQHIRHELRGKTITIERLSARVSDMLSDDDPRTAELKQHVNHIRVMAHELSLYVDNLAALTEKSLTASLPTRVRFSEFMEYVKDAIETLRSSRPRAVALNLLRGDSATWLSLNTHELKHILYILLDNAFRFSPANSQVWVDVKLVSLDKTAHFVVVSIHNLSERQSAEFWERCWLNFRTQATRHKLSPTRGFGLLMAQKLLKKNDWQLDFVVRDDADITKQIVEARLTIPRQG